MTFSSYLRKFLSASFLMLLLLPVHLQAKTLVGVVMSGNTPYFSAMHRAFSESLLAGLPADAEIQFILQKPFPDKIALSNAARKLVVFESNVIVAYGSPAVQAVLEEKSEIPMVYGGVYDPDIARFAGENATGCGYKIPISSLLRYLLGIKEINQLDVIYSGRDMDSLRQVNELISMLTDPQIILNKIDIKNREELEKIQAMVNGDAVFITGSAIANLFIHDILLTLKERGLPSAFLLPDIDSDGVTITLFNSPTDQGRMMAEMALKLINGQKPADIKPEILRKTDLTFNLKEAQKMSIKVPFNLVVEATELIR